MKKKVLLIIGLFGMTSIYTTDVLASESLIVEDVIEQGINNYAPLEITSDNLVENENEFNSENNSTKLTVSKNPKQEIILEDKTSSSSNDISISLDDNLNGNPEMIDDVILFSSKDEYSLGIESFEGGIRQTFIIESNDAPKEYKLKYNLPEGSYLEKAVNEDGQEDGSILIMNSNHESIGAIWSPWATDSKGNNINTYYKIMNDTELVQVVEHDENNAYPIVADPTTFSTYFKSGKWINRNGLISLSLKPSGITRFTGSNVAGVVVAAVQQDSWTKVKNTFKNQSKWKNEKGLYNQYICHFRFAFWKSEFNLEPSRKDVGLAKTIAIACNP